MLLALTEFCPKDLKAKKVFKFYRFYIQQILVAVFVGKMI